MKKREVFKSNSNDSSVFIVLTHMECFLFKFFVRRRRTISIVYTLIHVRYCNCNIGRQLIDHLPFLFHHSIDLHIFFLISFSIHKIVYSNLSSIFFYKYICQLTVIGHNEGI